MINYYIVSVKSNRGYEVLRTHTSINPDSKPQSFKNEMIQKVKNFYFDKVSDIEILTVKNEKYMNSI